MITPRAALGVVAVGLALTSVLPARADDWEGVAAGMRDGLHYLSEVARSERVPADAKAALFREAAAAWAEVRPPPDLAAIHAMGRRAIDMAVKGFDAEARREPGARAQVEDAEAALHAAFWEVQRTRAQRGGAPTR